MQTKDILSDIIADKRIEIARQKESMPQETLQTLLKDCRKQRSMSESLRQSHTGIIAEFKRRSPSKGWICREAVPEQIAETYEQAGASALSILTDELYFGGNLGDLQAVRPITGLPILRKDFIIDEYQLLQAKLYGADAVLLIAATLTEEQCNRLTEQAHRLELEVLLEIHREEELRYIQPETDMIGVNNRNLGSFATDVNNSFRLAAYLPKDKIWVSESGISDPQTVLRLRRCGYKGFLIGESLMKAPDTAQMLRRFTECHTRINPIKI